MLQEWTDPKLSWNPVEYGDVSELYVPAEEIWTPDLVLYNNADGFPSVTIMTKATLRHDGKVSWSPPAVFKTACAIEIEAFPFDTQTCFWDIGSWTHNEGVIFLRVLDNKLSTSNETSKSIDLSEYYLNVEYDVMNVSGEKRILDFDENPFARARFSITLRRKTLFYTINLILPCISISCMSILVFYLPSDSGEKVSLSISILLSLTFFLLVLIEIIPSTSLSMPLIGRYLCFTMILVTLSCVVTIAILNIHFRSPSTHIMSPRVRKIFIHTLPKMLLMKPPQYRLEHRDDSIFSQMKKQGQTRQKSHKKCRKPDRAPPTASNGPPSPLPPPPPPPPLSSQSPQPPTGLNGETLSINELDSSPGATDRGAGRGESYLASGFGGLMANYPREIEKAIINIMFIAQHIDNTEEFESIKEDWKYVAMVLDRIFLWVFTVACIVGTIGIFSQAPTLYDYTQPIDIKQSLIAKDFARSFPELSEMVS
ncbi:acetylcholine receptor subunit alpha-like 1 isoform X2 [Brevipalpus obovatus]